MKILYGHIDTPTRCIDKSMKTGCRYLIYTLVIILPTAW